jgi:hypothetical protein
MAKGVNEVDSWAVASYVDCRLDALTVYLLGYEIEVELLLDHLCVPKT